MQRALAFVVLTWTAGCSIGLDPPPSVVQARFDPQAQVVPMPNDILRDATSGLLALPIDDSLTDAEKELRTWMNQLDGWPTTLTASLKFTAPIDATTVGASSVQVWRWGDAPTEVTSAVAATVDNDGTTLTLTPPETGWDRGATYIVVARGGKEGLRGKQHEPVIADAAFYFLRLQQPLDDPRHQRAFPGDTIDERMANAKKLEVIRQQLVPYFDFFEARGIPRKEIASLWAFSPTTRSELAMDVPSQRMPLPFDLLIDRTTSRIAIPPHTGDLPVEAEGKQRLAEYDGWGLSAGMMFETTAPLADHARPGRRRALRHRRSDAPAAGDAQGLLRSAPRRGDAEDAAARRVAHLRPRREGHARGRRRPRGRADDHRPLHALQRRPSPTACTARSAATSPTRTRRASSGRASASRALLDQIGRDHVVTAIPFTTQTVVAKQQAVIDKAASLGPAAVPKNIVHQTPLEALGQFALGISSLLYVGDVYIGTLSMPIWLDDTTRGWHADGSYKMRDVEFTHDGAAQRQGARAGRDLRPRPRHHEPLRARARRRAGAARVRGDLDRLPVPRQAVALHGRRRRHRGRRSADGQGHLAAAVPVGRDLQRPRPLRRRAGQGHHLAMFPIVNMPVATGAAFIEIDHVANTKDHFQQALVDLDGAQALAAQADWSFTSAKLDGTKLYYSGQSLGGIIGGLFVSMAPEIQRAVLNVPGGGLVDMFRNSTFFAPQVNGFFTRNNIDPNSWEAARFLNLARLFLDAIDPASVAGKLQGRPVFIQMATLDLIIPNANTEHLQTISGAPRRDYVAEHAFIVVPVEPAFLPGQADLGDFLTGKLVP